MSKVWFSDDIGQPDGRIVRADDVARASLRERGRLGVIRGRTNELRVLDVLLGSEPRPWWLRAARRSTPNEDRLGIDIVVYSSDLGSLHLQVKSSPNGAKLFRSKDRKRGLTGPIGVVVVRDAHGPEELYGVVLAALIGVREALAKRMNPKRCFRVDE